MENPLADDLDHVLAHTEHVWAAVRGERFFITGGTGFVGTWLTESLLWANRRLGLGISAVLLSRDPDAFRARSPHLAADSAVTVLKGDAATFDYPDGAFPLVVHAATERWFAPDADRPTGTFDADVAATRRVLELARQRGTTRFLFTSSGAVYGRQPTELSHIPEEYPGAPDPLDTNASYGHAKRVSEFLCAGYQRVHGLHVAVARLFAFIGPHLPLNENFAAGNFLRDVLVGGPIRIGGDGTPYRSYLYAADLAIWLWVIFLRGESGRAYNVGSPREVSIAELARRVVAGTSPGMAIETARQPVPGAAATRYVPATDRAERELNLQTWIPLDEGIRRTYAWYLRRRQRQAGRPA